MIRKVVLITMMSVIVSYNLSHCEEIKAKNRYCNDDVDCVLFEPSCCWGCSPSSSINKAYLDELKLEREKKCKSFNDVCKQVECMPIEYEAYCDEKGYCNKRIDCKRTCELMGISGFDYDYAKKQSGCSCKK